MWTTFSGCSLFCFSLLNLCETYAFHDIKTKKKILMKLKLEPKYGMKKEKQANKIMQFFTACHIFTTLNHCIQYKIITHAFSSFAVVVLCENGFYLSYNVEM